MKLVVIGGVAAGMSLAARARRLDESAEIVVLERSDHVSFANCGLPYHIGGEIERRDALLLQTPERLKASLNLDVRVAQEATAIDRGRRRVTVRDRKTGRTYEESYDFLGLCPGATPIRPALPGVDLPGIRTLRNMEDMDAILGDMQSGVRHATVIGAGYIGVEMAENLVRRGVRVTLVEMLDQIMPPLDREMTGALEDELKRRGVVLHLETAAAAFRHSATGRLQVELKNGVTLDTDMTLLCVGVRPDVALAKTAGLEFGPRGGIRVDEHQRTADPNIFAAGDAVEVRHQVLPDTWLIPLAGPANRQGRVAAENICGRDTVFTPVQGTAIVKVFDLTAGVTGATEKNLQRAGMPYRKCYLHPSGHAGYYPGTGPMQLKLLFAPDTGRLLGAQAVGFDGVDKRLDVLATAIRAGQTARDLQDAELAYAPPYGSAKDPVNMAGFIATNLLQGDLQCWYAEEFPARAEKGLVLDVRSPQEYETGHVPGAVNIPLDELRRRLGELPRDREILTYCRVGFRSYLAYRILTQNGFRAASLAGGFNTFRAWRRQAPEPDATQAFEPYAEPPAAAAPPGRTVTLDCLGLQCPGPIIRLKETMSDLDPGDQIVLQTNDPGFIGDAPAWCAAQGHTLVEITTAGPQITARIRKGGPAAKANPTLPAASGPRKKSIVVFSGDLDRVMAAFVIANGALAMGDQVSIFFTFWGLNALRKSAPPPVAKGLLDRMFGWMMPRGPTALKLSSLNMAGIGTALMKKVMRDKRVDSLPELMRQAREQGARLIACSMSMDVMGMKKEELLDGIEVGGVASFLGEANGSNATLFI